MVKLASSIRELLNNPGHDKKVVGRLRRIGQSGVSIERLVHGVVPQDIDEIKHMRRGFHTLRVYLVELLHIAQNRVQLLSKALFFLALSARRARRATCSTCASEINISPSPPQASGERLHRCELGQQFLDAMVTKEHREFELFAVPLTFLHHSTAKMLMEDPGPDRIGWRRGCCTADRC